MRLLIWALGLCVGGFSLTVISMNWGLLFQSLRAKPGEKTPSLLPIIGGLVGFGAVAVAARMHAFAHHAQPWWGRYAWLPILLDPGCYLIALPFVGLAALWRRLRRK